MFGVMKAKFLMDKKITGTGDGQGQGQGWLLLIGVGILWAG